MKPRGPEAVLGTRSQGTLSLPVGVFLAYMKTLADAMPRALLWPRLFQGFCSHPLADSIWGPLCPVPPRDRAQIPSAASALPTAALYLQIPLLGARAAACAQPRGCCRLHGRVAAAGSGPRAAGGREQPVAPGAANAAHIPAAPAARQCRSGCARPAWAAGGLPAGGTSLSLSPLPCPCRHIPVPAGNARLPVLPRCCSLQPHDHPAQGSRGDARSGVTLPPAMPRDGDFLHVQLARVGAP